MLPSLYLIGQNFEFYICPGICHSNMTELKGFQSDRLRAMGVPGEITDNFPATLCFTGEPRLKFNKFSVGIQYSYASTGSRVSYSDYSGVLNLDLISSSHKIGPSLAFSAYNFPHMNINLDINTPLIFTKVTKKDYKEINGESTSIKSDYYSRSIGIQPAAEITYSLSFIIIGLRAGYLLDTGAALYEKHNRGVYLRNMTSSIVHSNWTGYKIDFILGFLLSKYK